MKALLVSANPNVRDLMALTLRSVERSIGEPIQFLEASDGLQGIRMAWRNAPDIIVADEIASRAGAFALTKDLKGAIPPFTGRIVILLERALDSWLASWSGADAWFSKPVNPFELADTIAGFFPVQEPAR